MPSICTHQYSVAFDHQRESQLDHMICGRVASRRSTRQIGLDGKINLVLITASWLYLLFRFLCLDCGRRGLIVGPQLRNWTDETDWHTPGLGLTMHWNQWLLGSAKHYYLCVFSTVRITIAGQLRIWSTPTVLLSISSEVLKEVKRNRLPPKKVGSAPTYFLYSASTPFRLDVYVIS